MVGAIGPMDCGVSLTGIAFCLAECRAAPASLGARPRHHGRYRFLPANRLARFHRLGRFISDLENGGTMHTLLGLQRNQHLA